MTKDEYCVKVCGGKCCYMPAHGKNCNHLKCGACRIYKTRFRPGHAERETVDVIGKQQMGKIVLMPVVCTTINALIRDNKLPEDIAAGCCYVHPELLEKDYGISQT